MDDIVKYCNKLEAVTAVVENCPACATIEEVFKFFNNFEGVEKIEISRDENTKDFKGNIHLIFKAEDLAKKFIEQQTVLFHKSDLLLTWQKDYIEEKSKERVIIDQLTNTIVHFENVPQNVRRETVRQVFEELNTGVEIAYLVHNVGLTEGYVRFKGQNAADDFLKKVPDHKIKFNDVTLSIRKATQQEEQIVQNIATTVFKIFGDFHDF